MIKTIVVLALAITLVWSAKGEEFPPVVGGVHNEEEQSTISGICHFVEDSHDNIECEFTQSDFTPNYKKETDSTEHYLSKTSDKEVLEFQKKLCSDFRKAMKGMTSKFESEMGKIAEKYCKGPGTKESTRTYFKGMNEFENTVCTIRENSFKLSFKRTGKFKWISDSSPQGICNISKVITLESKDGYSWVFRQVKMAVGNTENSFCKGFDEDIGKPYVYSYEQNGTFETPGCKYIKFNP